MTVKELIEKLSKLPDSMSVHTDEDDYPHVTDVRLGSEYEGPADYMPPDNCVLLTIDFPK